MTTVLPDNVTRAAEVFRQKHARFRQVHAETFPSRRRGTSRVAAESEVKEAAARVEKLEALLEIGHATEAQVEAARRDLDEVKTGKARALEMETYQRRRKAKLQVPALRSDVKAAKQEVAEAQASIVSGDVKELSGLLQKALEVNARIAAAEDAIVSQLPHPATRNKQLGEDIVRRVTKWLERVS